MLGHEPMIRRRSDLRRRRQDLVSRKSVVSATVNANSVAADRRIDLFGMVDDRQLPTSPCPTVRPAISSIRSSGTRARSITSGDNSIRGSRSRSATYSFSSVLSAMYGHILQLQLPSPPGTPMKVLSGAAFSIWWMMCGSVATRIVSAGERQREIEDRLGRSDMVGMVDDVRRAFGMRRDRRVRDARP